MYLLSTRRITATLLGCTIFLFLFYTGISGHMAEASSASGVVLEPRTVKATCDYVETEPVAAGPIIPHSLNSAPGPSAPFPEKLKEICYGKDIGATRVPHTFLWDDGTSTGFYTSVSPGDEEAVTFKQEHAFHIKYIHCYFRGGTGNVKIHIYGGNSVSWEPNVDEEVIAPVPVTVSVLDDWTVIDVSSYGAYMHPAEFFWVTVEHEARYPALGYDATRDTDYCSRMNQSSDEWGYINHDYMLRVEGDYICENTSPFFDDVSSTAGIDTVNYVRTVFVDVNNDNYDDMFFTVSKGSVTDLDHEGLFINQTDGTFLDVSDTCGLRGNALAFGAFGDVDNDGDLDLFGAVWTDPASDKGTRDMIFYNDGTGNFTKNTAAGVNDDCSTGAAGFADYDADGYIDLYVGNWLIEYPNIPAYQDFLYKNDGDGTFTDVTDAAGLGDQGPQNRPCYGVAWCDFDNDDDMDCFVGNYGRTANFLWQNQGDGTFLEMASFFGVDQDDLGAGGNTFGEDWGDFDNDGYMDIYLGEIAHPRYLPWSDKNSLQRNGGWPMFKFTDVREASNIAYDEGEIEATWFDYDNDGDLDLFTSCLYGGHYARLYRQEWDHTFTDVTYLGGIYIHDAVAHAMADYDRDGDLDILASSRAGNYVYLLENKVGNKNDWLHVKLVGTDCNRAAIGARVTVIAGDLTMIREVQGGKGHNSCQSSMPVEFGLGKFKALKEVRVKWPCGRIESFTTINKNAFVIIQEGNPTVTYDHYTPVPAQSLPATVLLFIPLTLIIGYLVYRYNG